MDIEAAANKKQELINGFKNLIDEKDKRIEVLINEKKENEKKYQEDVTKLTKEISKLKEDFNNEKKENEKKYQEDITKLTKEIQELQKSWWLYLNQIHQGFTIIYELWVAYQGFTIIYELWMAYQGFTNV